MLLLEFHQDGSDKPVTVSPVKVESIEPGHEHTVITMQSGREHTVSESYVIVRDAVRMAGHTQPPKADLRPAAQSD